MKGVLNVADRFVGEAFAAQSNGICTVTTGVIPYGSCVRQRVFDDNGKASDEGVTTDAAILMHCTVSPNGSVIADSNVTGERSGIREYNV